MIFSKPFTQKNYKFFLLLFINFIFYSLQIISGPCCSKESKIKAPHNTPENNSLSNYKSDSETSTLMPEYISSTVAWINRSATSDTQVNASQNSSHATAKQDL